MRFFYYKFIYLKRIRCLYVKAAALALAYVAAQVKVKVPRAVRAGLVVKAKLRNAGAAAKALGVGFYACRFHIGVAVKLILIRQTVVGVYLGLLFGYARTDTQPVAGYAVKITTVKLSPST